MVISDGLLPLEPVLDVKLEPGELPVPDEAPVQDEPEAQDVPQVLDERLVRDEPEEQDVPQVLDEPEEQDVPQVLDERLVQGAARPDELDARAVLGDSVALVAVVPAGWELDEPLEQVALLGHDAARAAVLDAGVVQLERGAPAAWETAGPGWLEHYGSEVRLRGYSERSGERADSIQGVPEGLAGWLRGDFGSLAGWAPDDSPRGGSEAWAEGAAAIAVEQ